MCGAPPHVRFYSDSDREKRASQNTMSALPSKADTCSATSNVGDVPKADMGQI